MGMIFWDVYGPRTQICRKNPKIYIECFLSTCLLGEMSLHVGPTPGTPNLQKTPPQTSQNLKPTLEQNLLGPQNMMQGDIYVLLNAAKLETIAIKDLFSSVVHPQKTTPAVGVRRICDKCPASSARWETWKV